VRFRTKQSRLFWTFALVGAFSFWTPDVVIHSVSGRGFDIPQVLAITFVSPLTWLLAYVSFAKVANHRGYKAPGIAMLVGVWLSGGLFIMLAATTEGAGFATTRFPDSVLVIAASVIPVFTWMLSAYDGSLFALLGVTFFAGLVWAIRNDGLPNIPPSSE